MRKRLTISFIALLMVMTLALAACSKDNTGSSSPSADNASSSAAPQSQTPSESAAPPEPLGKYETPITITSVAGSAEGAEFPPGDSLEKNVWTRSFLADLGIELKYDWIVNADQYDEKLNVSIVGNDLPDFYKVDARQFQMLIEGDLLADLTEVFDSYALDYVKEAYNGISREAATFKGKLMGIPANGGNLDTAPLLWIRTDWLEKLGLSEPKTMEDLLVIIDRFVKDDPDGNNKADTFGLTVNKDIFGSIGGLEGFFNGFGAYPYNKETTMWLKDDSGKLVYAGIQPEVRDGLEALQKLFAMGAIDREFGTQDPAKVAESVLNGKTGVFYGPFNVPGWPLRNFKTQNPDGELKPFSIVTIDGKQVLASVASPAPSQFYVVNKKAKYPEAIVKMLNYYYEKIYGEHNDLENFHTVTNGEKNYPVHNYSPIRGGLPENNQKAYYAVVDALKSSDPSNLNNEQKTYYDTILQYRAGDATQYFRELMFSENGAFGVLGEYKKNDSFQLNQFLGAPTSTLVEIGSTLKDLELQMYTKVIMGAPLTEFDQFVDKWNQLGGDKITKEVNEWYALK